MEVYMGTIQAFGFSFAPQGWITCQGQLLPISQYEALFTLLGTTFGGDGQQTFALPDLQGRTIVGQGTSSDGHAYPIGQMSGMAHLTLTQNQMPAHTHAATETGGTVSVSAPAYEDVGNSPTPGPTTVLAQPTSGNPYSTESPSTTMAAGNGTISSVNIQVGIAGGSQPVDIESPYLALYYCVATEGYYPSRD